MLMKIPGLKTTVEEIKTTLTLYVLTLIQVYLLAGELCVLF